MKLLEILVLANMILSRSLVIRFYTCVFSFVFFLLLFWLRERICLGRLVIRAFEQLRIDFCSQKSSSEVARKPDVADKQLLFFLELDYSYKGWFCFVFVLLKVFFYRVYRTMLLEFLN